ncbi:MAG: hypothetical protein WCV55_03315 [Candidatus Paceibacterota bacterium]
MKKMLEAKLKDMPKEQRDKIMDIIEKNPDLLKSIAEEAMAKTKQGKSQMDAITEVIKSREAEVKKAFGNN